MLSRSSLFCLVAQKYLFAVWLFFRSDWVHTTPVFKLEQSYQVVDGVHKFLDTFVDNFIDCPASLKACEGIGQVSSMNCIECCDDHRKDEERRPQVMAIWLIAVIVVAALSGLICLIGIPTVLVIRARQRNSVNPEPAVWDNISCATGTRLIGSSSVSSFDDSVTGSTLHGETTYY